MKDKERPQDLTVELKRLRKRVAELEAADVERQSVEETLRRNEERFRTLIESSLDVVTVVDAKGTVLYQSPNYTIVWGRDASGEAGKDLFKDIYPEDIPLVGDAFVRLLKNPAEPVQLQIRALHTDGALRNVDVVARNQLNNPAVGGIVLTFRDITERKKADRALLESEEKFRRMLDRTNDLVWTADLDLRLTYMSPSVEQVLGFKPEEVVGTEPETLLTPESIARARQFYKEGLEWVQKHGPDPKHTWTIELEYHRKDGSTVWMEALVGGLRDEQGVMLGVQGVSRDITARRKAEELIKLQRDIAQNLSVITELRDGLDYCLQAAISASQMDCGGIYIMNSETGALTMASHIGLSQAFVEVTSQYDADHPSTRLVMKGKPTYIMYQDLKVPKDDIRRQEGLRSIAIIPFFHEGRVIGCLNVSSHKLEQIPQETRDMLEIISRQIGGAIAGLQTEEALRESEEKLRILFRTVGVGITVTDMNGKILDVNNVLLEVTGFGSREELIGRNGFDFISGRDRDRAMEAFTNVMVLGSGIPMELNLLRKDGSEYICETDTTVMKGKSGRPIGMIIVQRDITERRRVEVALKESEEKHRMIAELSKDIICIVDLNGVTTYASPSVERILGYSSDEIVGKGVFDFVSEREKARGSEMFARGIGGNMIPDVEIEEIRKDGTTVYVEYNNAFIKDGEKITGILSIGRDVTERKKAEEALRESEEKFRKLTEASNVGIAITDGQRFLYANPAVRKMSGFSEEEYLSMPLVDFVTPDSRALIAQRAMDRLAGKPVPDTYEISVLTKDGGIKWAEVGAVVIEYYGKLVTIFTLYDITERRRVEVALKESEERFRQITENMLDAVSLLDKDGIIRYASPSHEEIVGYKPEELVGKTSLELTHPEDRESVLAALEGIFEKREAKFQYRFRHADGHYVWGDALCKVLYDDGGNISNFVISSRDITERKKAEEALRESEQRFKQVSQSVGELIWEVDTDGLYTYISSTIEKILGYRPDEVVGRMHFYDFFAPEEREDLSKAAFEVFARRESFKGFVNANIHRNGRRVLLETSGVPILNEQGRFLGYRGADTDVTERKKAEEALRESEEMLSQIVEESTVPTFVISKEHVVTYWNKACENLTGIPKDHVSGTKNQWRAFYKEERPVMADLMVDQTSEEIIARHYDKKYRKSALIEGAYEAEDFFPVLGKVGKWLFFTAAPIRDSAGNISGAIETLQDTTDRKKAEEEVKLLNSNLEQRVRERTAELEAINQELEAFSYSVSHDLRAPLRSIDGFSLALMEDYGGKLEGEGKDYLRRVRAATQYMGQLIDDMLNLSRITRAEMTTEKVDLTQIARSILNELQKSQPERRVEIRIADGIEGIADPKLMRIVLENLLGNAWKFTGKQEQAAIEFGSKTDGGKTVYFVRDNGAGFDMTYVGKLFAPFQRLHSTEEFPGIGIGLATVRRIIRRHGGRVWAEGQVDKGASFYFSLKE